MGCTFFLFLLAATWLARLSASAPLVLGIDFGNASFRTYKLGPQSPLSILLSSSGSRSIPSAIAADPNTLPVIGKAALNAAYEKNSLQGLLLLVRDQPKWRSIFRDCSLLSQFHASELLARFLYEAMRGTSAWDGARWLPLGISFSLPVESMTRRTLCALKDAVSIAGLGPIVSVVSATEAAARDFVVSKMAAGEGERLLLIVDVGATASEGSLVSCSHAAIAIEAQRSLPVGGLDATQAIRSLLIDRLGVSLSEKEFLMLGREAEEIKIEFSRSSTCSQVTRVIEGVAAAGPVSISLTRDEVAAAVRPLFTQKIAAMLEELVAVAAEKVPGQLSEALTVVPIGSGSRLWVLREEKALPASVRIWASLDVDETSAAGAALSAASLQPAFRIRIKPTIQLPEVGVGRLSCQPDGLKIEKSADRHRYEIPLVPTSLWDKEICVSVDGEPFASFQVSTAATDLWRSVSLRFSVESPISEDLKAEFLVTEEPQGGDGDSSVVEPPKPVAAIVKLSQLCLDQKAFIDAKIRFQEYLQKEKMLRLAGEAKYNLASTCDCALDRISSGGGAFEPLSDGFRSFLAEKVSAISREAPSVADMGAKDKCEALSLQVAALLQSVEEAFEAKKKLEQLLERLTTAPPTAGPSVGEGVLSFKRQLCDELLPCGEIRERLAQIEKSVNGIFPVEEPKDETVDL